MYACMFAISERQCHPVNQGHRQLLFFTEINHAPATVTHCGSRQNINRSLPAVCSWWCSASHTGTPPVWRCVFLLQSAWSWSGSVGCWCGYRRCTEVGPLRENQQSFICWVNLQLHWCLFFVNKQSSLGRVMEPSNPTWVVNLPAIRLINNKSDKLSVLCKIILEQQKSAVTQGKPSRHNRSGSDLG